MSWKELTSSDGSFPKMWLTVYFLKKMENRYEYHFYLLSNANLEVLLKPCIKKNLKPDGLNSCFSRYSI